MNVLSLSILKKNGKKIMIYSQLNGFYQSHLRYFKSKSDDQWNGKNIQLAEMKDSQDCDPEKII